jgi:hypothetical protein
MCQQFLFVVNDTGEAYLTVFIDTDEEFVISVKLLMMNALPVSITATAKNSRSRRFFAKKRTNFHCKHSCGSDVQAIPRCCPGYR